MPRARKNPAFWKSAMKQAREEWKTEQAARIALNEGARFMRNMRGGLRMSALPPAMLLRFQKKKAKHLSGYHAAVKKRATQLYKIFGGR
jgi:hypothetical protein